MDGRKGGNAEFGSALKVALLQEQGYQMRSASEIHAKEAKDSKVWVAIHASAQEHVLAQSTPNQPRGAVIGVGLFDRCLPLAACACHPASLPPLASKYVWVLGHTRPLPSPIAASGKLSLWSVGPLFRAALARIACDVNVTSGDWERVRHEQAMLDELHQLRRSVSAQRKRVLQDG